MPDTMISQITTSSRADPWAGQHDGGTIVLHWITALLVVALFALAEIWGFLPHGPGRRALQELHVSLGCILVVIVVARLAWRIFGANRLPHPGLMGKLAQAGHGMLYLLLITMAITGPLKRWAGGHALNVFWLFSLPSPMAAQPMLRAPIGFIHVWVAWGIILLAGLHAVVALHHHHVLKDGVLRRMMPRRRSV